MARKRGARNIVREAAESRGGRLNTIDQEYIRHAEALDFSQKTEYAEAGRQIAQLLAPCAETMCRLTDEHGAEQPTWLCALQEIGECVPNASGRIELIANPGMMRDMIDVIQGSCTVGDVDPNSSPAFQIRMSGFAGQVEQISRFHRANGFAVRLFYTGDVLDTEGIVGVCVFTGDQGVVPTTVAEVRRQRLSEVYSVNQLRNHAISTACLPNCASARRSSGGVDPINPRNSILQEVDMWEMHVPFPPYSPVDGGDAAATNWKNGLPKIVIVAEGLATTARLALQVEYVLEGIPLTAFVESKLPTPHLGSPSTMGANLAERLWHHSVHDPEESGTFVAGGPPGIDVSDIGVPNELVEAYRSISTTRDLINYMTMAAKHSVPEPALFRQVKLMSLAPPPPKPFKFPATAPKQQQTIEKTVRSMVGERRAREDRRRRDRGRESLADREAGEEETIIDTGHKLIDHFADSWDGAKTGVGFLDRHLGHMNKAARIIGHLALKAGQVTGEVAPEIMKVAAALA